MTKYVLWMLLASALGFFKLLALASTMPSYEFGRYVTYFGIASFSSPLLSFGIIEKTIKNYPRRWMTGHRSWILIDALHIGRILTLRFLVAGGLVLALAFFNLIPLMSVEVFCTTGLGLCTGLLALVGSLYRTTGSKMALQSFTCSRSALVLVMALPAGGLFGWQGAIGGDIVGSLLGIGYAFWQLPRLFKNELSSNTPNTLESAPENGHFQLYLANLAVAPQSMLDRGWVSGTLGPMLAGSYGVVMLIPQATQLLGNVIVQYIGPLVIKLVHINQSGTDRRSSIEFNAALLAIFSLAITVSALIAKRIPSLDHFFGKYEISDLSLVIVGILACGQIYGLIEFHLIAHNRERDVLAASLASCFIFIATFAIAGMFHASIEWFLAGAGAARWGQVWLLRRAYMRYA